MKKPFFADQVEAYALKHRLIPSKSHILVACSGGPDSTALLIALVAMRRTHKLNLTLCYVDHGLRPVQVRKEKTYVKSLGKLYGVPVVVVRKQLKKQGGESLEAAARAMRYQKLMEVAQKHTCSVVAVGHTRDDQAETILMRLLRGTGTVGLVGMRPKRLLAGSKKTLIRPLLGVTRKQVEQFVKDHGLKPMEDQSNQSRAFFRNQVRQDLLPLLEKTYSPNLRGQLAQLAEIAQMDMDWMDAQAQKIFQSMAVVRQKRVSFKPSQLSKQPQALRMHLYRLAVERLAGTAQGYEAQHWFEMDALLLSGAVSAQNFPSCIVAKSSKDHSSLNI